jgi:hypothetical protein
MDRIGIGWTQQILVGGLNSAASRDGSGNATGISTTLGRDSHHIGGAKGEEYTTSLNAIANGMAETEIGMMIAGGEIGTEIEMMIADGEIGTEIGMTIAKSSDL